MYVKKTLFEKFNINGSKRTTVLTDNELNTIGDKEYNKLIELLDIK